MGVIIISSRAKFAEAFPYAGPGPSDQAGEIPYQEAVQSHRILVAEAGQVVRTQGHRLSTLRERVIVVDGRANGLG